jgi:hypothetical protein
MPAYRQALVLVAEKQTNALASLARLVLRGHELGLAVDDMADLRQSRVGLSYSLGLILDEITGAEQFLGLPIDG